MQRLGENPRTLLLWEFNLEREYSFERGRLLRKTGGAFNLKFDNAIILRAAENCVGSTVLLYGFICSHSHHIPEESQRIQKVALPRSVPPHQDRQRFQRHIAERDAL